MSLASAQHDIHISEQALPCCPLLKLNLEGAVCVGSIVRRPDMESTKQENPLWLPISFAIPMLPLVQRNGIRSISVILQAAIAANSHGKDRTTLRR
jgi:hypothetical protein